MSQAARARDAHATTMGVLGWNGEPLPPHAERLRLPDGRMLEDAIIWPEFCQDELALDPDELWRDLLAMPTWPADREIPFRRAGDDPHWISGEHAALRYRGCAVKRDKIWCQSEYSEGLRRYGYTGWQHRISMATHAVELVQPVHRLAQRLNAGLVRSGHRPHNHWIVTRYAGAEDNIGFHSDKEKDFAENSYFIVIKLGAPRPFAFRMRPSDSDPNPKPFFNEVLSTGSAVLVRCKTPGAANDIVQHGVPTVGTAVGMSGSIVSRCITTVIPWEEEVRRVEAGRRNGA